MRKKLTKKYAHHTAFYVDHAHIFIFFKLLMQDWITLRGHEPLISFFKFLRSHSSLNAKIHILNDIGGSVQEDDGPFWRVRCNRNLKNQASLNLLGFFEILMQNILHWVKNMKCRKLNHLSEYITFMYRKFA